MLLLIVSIFALQTLHRAKHGDSQDHHADEPEMKEALRSPADREHRPIATMIEVLIRDYCGIHDITIQTQQTRSLDDQRKP